MHRYAELQDWSKTVIAMGGSIYSGARAEAIKRTIVII